MKEFKTLRIFESHYSPYETPFRISGWGRENRFLKNDNFFNSSIDAEPLLFKSKREALSYAHKIFVLYKIKGRKGWYKIKAKKK